MAAIPVRVGALKREEDGWRCSALAYDRSLRYDMRAYVHTCRGRKREDARERTYSINPEEEDKDLHSHKSKIESTLEHGGNCEQGLLGDDGSGTEGTRHAGEDG